jgi:thiol-disulfide isomerase/thioredoxin
MSLLALRSLAALAVGVCAGCSAASPVSVASATTPSVGSARPAQRGQALILDATPAVPAAEAPSSPLMVSTRQTPGWLGVALSAQPPDRAGVLISSVLRRSPAALGGLEVGDAVVAIDDVRVNDPSAMSHLVAALGAGRRASFMVKRQGADRLLSIDLGDNPGYEGQLRLGFVDAGAPEFEHVEVAQGGVAPRLEALRGQVVVLEFWATWCGACRALLPTLNEWHERLQGKGGLVVSVTVDPVGKAAQDAAQLGLRYPVLADPEGKTAQAYQAFALPTLFVIDRAGIVRDVSVGYDPERLEALQATVARLLSES